MEQADQGKQSREGCEIDLDTYNLIIEIACVTGIVGTASTNDHPLLSPILESALPPPRRDHYYGNQRINLATYLDDLEIYWEKSGLV